MLLITLRPLQHLHGLANRCINREGQSSTAKASHHWSVVVDSPFTEFVRTPLGSSLVVGAAVVAVLGTIFWARQRGHSERWNVVAGGSVGASEVALLNLVLGTAGIWRSTDYSLPALVLGSDVLLVAVLLAWVVAFYRLVWRWLPARIIAAPLLLAIALLTIAGDESALARHYIAFGDGYTAWMDGLVAVTIFVVPVLAYELIRRLRASPVS